MATWLATRANTGTDLPVQRLMCIRADAVQGDFHSLPSRSQTSSHGGSQQLHSKPCRAQDFAAPAGRSIKYSPVLLITAAVRPARWSHPLPSTWEGFFLRPDV